MGDPTTTTLFTRSGISNGNRQTDRSPHTMTHQRCAGNSKLLHELVDQADKILDSIGLPLFARFPKSPKVQGIGAVIATQETHRLLPQAPGTQPAVQKDDGFPASIHFIMNDPLISSN